MNRAWLLAVVVACGAPAPAPRAPATPADAATEAPTPWCCPR